MYVFITVVVPQSSNKKVDVVEGLSVFYIALVSCSDLLDSGLRHTCVAEKRGGGGREPRLTVLMSCTWDKDCKELYHAGAVCFWPWM